jgi:hypothetical protein
MAIAEISALRGERAESNRLAWAFIISVAVHLLIYGGYQTGRRYSWWDNWRWPAWLEAAKLIPKWLKKKETQQPLQPVQVQQTQRELPLIFVDVDPAVATAEPPPKAKYYSALNSQAANPDSDKETDTPKITGKRPEIVRTQDVPREQPLPLQPAAAPAPRPVEKPQESQEPQERQEAKQELKPKATYTPGDLASAKPDLKPQNEQAPGDASEAQPTRPARPRTLAEAKARMQTDRLIGEKMKQEGGVKNRRMESSLDAQGTLFGAYDLAVVLAVQRRWYDLLDSRGWAADRTGKVSIRFHLNADGTVTEMKFMENTVDLALGMLCQSAIKDPSPFASWPSDMRRAIGANFREVTFTFYYY